MEFVKTILGLSGQWKLINVNQQILDSMQPRDRIDELETEIADSGDKELYRNFRSFRLLYPNGSEEDWKSFCGKPLFEAFLAGIENVPVSTILILCRRHQTELPYFLDYFDKSPKIAREPKMYLPYLCQRVETLPIQWILQHLLVIHDVRYAYRLLSLAFGNAVTVNRNEVSLIRARNEVWEKYKKITGSEDSTTNEEAWNSMMSMRVAMKELIDFKLTVRLVDYNRLKKEELVTRLLNTCTSAIKYEKLLRLQVGPYCQARNINIDQVVIATVPRKEWNVTQKLDIIKNFVEEPVHLKKSLDLMTFSTEAELAQIREFAEANGVILDVDPNNYLMAMNSPHSKKRLRRSPSAEFSDTKELEGNIRMNIARKAPSSSVFIKPPKISCANTMRKLANGEPDNPQEYAEKLRKFSSLREIKPIFELASNYGMVVAFDDYHEASNKRKLFVRLLKSAGLSEFDNVTELVQFSPDDVIESMLAEFEEMMESADMLLVHMSRFLRRANVDNFLSYLYKSVDYLIDKLTITNLCDLWASCLMEVVDVIDGRKVMETIDTIRVLQGIHDAEATEDRKRQLLDMFREKNDIRAVAQECAKEGWTEISEYIMPSAATDLKLDAFRQSISSKETEDVVTALTEVSVMDPQKAVELLIESIDAIDGTNYTRLLCVFSLLEERKLRYTKEISVLQVLQYCDLSVDFHELIESPMDVLKKVITKSNVWDVMPLAPLLSVQTDDLLVHLMLNVMNSRCFDDYQSFISMLKRKESIKPLLRGFPEKLKPSELPKFYQSIGNVEMKRKYLTINDLKAVGLSEFATDKYLDDPSGMICEIYSRMSLHESFGKRLHKLVKNLASRYDLSINKIREYLVSNWLTDIETKSSTGRDSVYVETVEEEIYKDENTNIQKLLFILRAWKPRTAEKWLLRFIYQSDPVSYRAKAKAFACLFAVSDEATIRSAFTGDFNSLLALHKDVYYRSRFEIFNTTFKPTNLTKKSVTAELHDMLAHQPELDPGVFTTLFELCIDFQISDRDILLGLVSVLKRHRKRFMLKHICILMETFPQYVDDPEFQQNHIEILSSPLDELIQKTENTRRFSAHHLSVVRDMLDALAQEPFKLEYWIIHGARVTWNELIDKLCDVGYAQLAAEIGSMIVDKTIRQSVMMQLLSSGHFDNALRFGFDRDDIFEYIVRDRVVQATETMIDEHFAIFVSWLSDRGDHSSLEIVKQTLMNQGRTMEVRRLLDPLVSRDDCK